MCDRLADQELRLIAGALDTQYGDESGLASRDILAYRLPGLARGSAA